MDQTSRVHIHVERTLALIKPDAIDKAEEIEDDVIKLGFVILQVGSNALENPPVRRNITLNTSKLRHLSTCFFTLFSVLIGLTTGSHVFIGNS